MLVSMANSTPLAVGIGAAVGAVAGVAASLWLARRSAPSRELQQLSAVVTSKASPAAGHYSQAVVRGGEVFVSGLLPITPDGTKLTADTFAGQTEQVLNNLEAILEASGSSLSQLLSVRVYISNIDDWQTFNAIYAKRLGSHRPARAVVPVPGLHFGFKLELEAIAAR